jgi:hypothetical protein
MYRHIFTLSNNDSNHSKDRWDRMYHITRQLSLIPENTEDEFSCMKQIAKIVAQKCMGHEYYTLPFAPENEKYVSVRLGKNEFSCRVLSCPHIRKWEGQLLNPYEYYRRIKEMFWSVCPQKIEKLYDLVPIDGSYHRCCVCDKKFPYVSLYGVIREKRDSTPVIYYLNCCGILRFPVRFMCKECVTFSIEHNLLNSFV